MCGETHVYELLSSFFEKLGAERKINLNKKMIKNREEGRESRIIISLELVFKDIKGNRKNKYIYIFTFNLKK